MPRPVGGGAAPAHAAPPPGPLAGGDPEPGATSPATSPNETRPVSPFAGLHVLVFAAHPDDEILGAGGQFGDMRQLSLVHLTDGVSTHREAWRRGWPTRGSYARARCDESIAAAGLGGVSFRYANLKCRDRRATFDMVTATFRLVQIIREHAPDLVLAQPYEGGHPDHDAAAFVAASACRLAGGQPLWEMASYHAAAAHVGEPHAATGRILTTEVAGGVFLDPPSADIHEVAIRLSPAACAVKRRMLACFASQRRQLEELGFDPAIERFRPAPRYDFGRSPHPGVLLYETQPWARMTSVRWRSAASTAREELARL